MQQDEPTKMDPKKRQNSPIHIKIGSTYEKESKPQPHTPYQQRLRGNKNVGLKAHLKFLTGPGVVAKCNFHLLNKENLLSNCSLN